MIKISVYSFMLKKIRPLSRMMSMIMRQNFSPKCEEKINDQINMELKACHQYLAMAYHFDRSDVASPGIYNFFLHASTEEREHAEMIMKYMNKRGGIILLSSVPEPVPCYKETMDAFKHALKLEMEVNQHLLDLHKLASDEGDPNLCDFIEANFLQEQVDGQKILADYIKQLERSNHEVGEYLFDKYMTAGMHGAKK